MRKQKKYYIFSVEFLLVFFLCDSCSHEKGELYRKNKTVFFPLDKLTLHMESYSHQCTKENKSSFYTPKVTKLEQNHAVFKTCATTTTWRISSKGDEEIISISTLTSSIHLRDFLCALWPRPSTCRLVMQIA
jgi:hypothetical protein